ncbi:MAG: C25 family cysteine peptidase [Bacteroidota bacterium]
MKRIFTLILISLALFTASAGEIVKTYYIGKPIIEQKGLKQSIRFDQSVLSGKAGEPMLPYFAVNLMLPPGHEAIRISYEGMDEISLSGNFTLLPGQYSRPLSDPGIPVLVENEDLYRSMDVYPLSATGNLSTQYRNGYGYAQSVFTPVKYIPGKGEISYFQKVIIRIETRETPKGLGALKNITSGNIIRTNCLKAAQNPEAIDNYPIRRATGSDYQILIITPQAFAGQLDALAQLYLPRGMKTQITTTQFIENNSNGDDMPEKIRNFIIQEYQQHGIEHVVLGGDVEHVAYRGFYCHVQSSSVYEDSNIPSDIYYSSLDGNWNTNGNNLWAEIGEDDLLPEVSVGRLSFSNTTELAAMLNKTIKYQNEPVTGELRNPLLAGEHLYDNPETWGSDYLELLIGTHDDNGYTTTGIPADHNIETMYDEDSNWSSYDLMNSINAGRNFIHHVGHANDTYVMKFYMWDITNSNFAGANGITHNFPVISTHGCICGAFDTDDCIAEEMVSIENFAALFIGNSRYGWFNEGQTEGPSAHLHREYVDAMFTDSLNRAGRAQVESKAATSPWVNAPGQWEEGALRWCFYDCNVLGDPAMAIWTDEPVNISTTYPASLTLGTGQFDVTVTASGNPVNGLTAALLMNGILYGTGTTGNDGTATVTIDPLVIEPGDAQLVISGYNCLPTYYPVMFVSGESPYVVYGSSLLNDSQGNNNGQADFGETVSLSITLQNIGLAQAQNVTATISSNDPFVTLTDAEESYGNIAAGGQVTVENGFTFQVSNDVPDNHILFFTLSAVADETWLSEFQITAYAPELQAGDALIDDGTGNGIPDPGETFDISIGLINSGHSSSLPVTAVLNCTSEWINGSEWTSGPLTIAAQSEESVNFEDITVSPQTPIGTIVVFTLALFQGNPSAVVLEREYLIVIGQVSEDFETGDFSQHPWAHSGNANWAITQIDPFEGSYSVKSGLIADNQESNLFVTYEVLTNDSIRFCYRVSSEATYDFLRFYIDNEKLGEWSGDANWERVTFPVTSGYHTFTWSYEKDISLANGLDAAWIDDIIFPPVDLNTGIGQPQNFLPELIVYPNPASEKINIQTNGATYGLLELTISDLTGKIVLPGMKIPATGKYEADISKIEPGLYFIRLCNDRFSKTQKLIIQ